MADIELYIKEHILDEDGNPEDVKYLSLSTRLLK